MSENNGKIAFFVPSLEGGGAERSMSQVASELAERGYSVDLILGHRSGPYLRELAPQVNIVDFNKSRMLFTLRPLIRYIRHEQPEVIVSAMGHTNIITLVAAMLSFRNLHVVVSERGTLSSSFPGREISTVLRRVMKVLYPRADAVVAVSDGLKQELLQDFDIPQELLHTIYNPVDIDDIQNRAQESVQHPWLTGEHEVFVAVGRLTPVKDVDTLLKAFSRLTPRYPKARLIIVGDGPDRSSLLALAKSLGIGNTVDFVGFKSNPYSWMNASDVYVLSSRSEGLSNSMLQAMACGVKIVSTDCEHGPPEILDHGKWGRLVPVGDAERLSEAMSEALMDESPPNVLSRVEHFSIDQIIEQYIDVLGLQKTM